MSKPFHSIPGPKELPFLGTLGALSDNPLRSLPALVDQYGDIVRFSFMGTQFVVLANPEYIREVLVEKANLFPKARRDVEVLGKFLGKGLVTNNGADHRKQRKLVQPAFHARRIQNYAAVMVEYADAVSAAWQESAVVDMSEEMMRLTLYIVAKTLFDADRQAMAGVAAAVGPAIDDLKEIADQEFSALLQLPDWLPTPQNRRRQRATTTVNGAIEQIVARRRAQAPAGQVEDTGDLLSMLLLAQDEQGAPLSDRQLRDELVTLFVAGHETTSNALTWTWYLLSQFPAIVQQLQAELDAVLGDRLPALADLPQLPYTLQVLKEAMRLYPPVWILNTREPLTETTIGDYTIPKGTQIFISQYIMHRRPQYFPEPERFDPTRWTPEFEAGLPRYAYMPFGGGPRICIGNSFALMEAQLLLATLARRFAFTLMPDQVVEPNPLVTLGAKYGMRMRVAVRRGEREPPVVQSPQMGPMS